MYDLFEDTNLPRYPTIKPGSMELLKRTYQREVLKVIDYYATRVTNIRNDHILNRMLVTGCPSLGYDLQKFLSLSKERVLNISDVIGLTYSANYGKIFKDVFYGGCMEVLLLDTDDFDEEEVYKDWKNVDAIRVLKHPFTDYELVPPFGQRYSDNDGLLTVLSINVAKLFVQYKGFIDSRRLMVAEERMNLNSTHFIKMHVIPNILRTHVEFVLYNRLKDMYYTLPDYRTTSKLPFPIINYDRIADDICGDIIQRYQDKPLSYAAFFQAIPGIFKENILESLMMPDDAKTKQVWWALFLTRLEDQFFAMHMLGEPGLNNNRKYYSKMLVDSKWFLKDNTFKEVVNKSVYSGYLSDMKDFVTGKI